MEPKYGDCMETVVAQPDRGLAGISRESTLVLPRFVLVAILKISAHGEFCA
jgi:hypothetical protein